MLLFPTACDLLAEAVIDPLAKGSVGVVEEVAYSPASTVEIKSPLIANERQRVAAAYSQPPQSRTQLRSL